MQLKAHCVPFLCAGRRRKWFPTKTLLVMRLTIIFLLAVTLQVSANSNAQTITYSAREVPLQKVFTAIRQQTDYTFFYRTEDLEGTAPVTVALKNMPLKNALQQILKDQPLDFEIQGKTIFVTRKPVVQKVMLEKIEYSISVQMLPPDNLKGRITDTDGNPLHGASIKVRGVDNGATTNAKGEFSLPDVDDKAILEITYVGFQKMCISVAGFKAIGVVALKRNDSKLDDVQVIAYGKTSERLSVGNVTTVKAEDIEKQPVTNPLLAIIGRVPGLFITQSSGVAGSGVRIMIQGQNSITNGNDPFYVIDGVPYTSQLLSTSNGNVLGRTGVEQYPNYAYNSYGNPLSFINPSDILSISVLKDADATAIYGSRAANGAILITTKKGSAGQTRVSFNLQQGWGKVARMQKLMNTKQYLEMRREAMANDGVTPSLTDYDVNGTWDTTRSTDWQKKLIGNTALYTNAYASISGGTANTQMLFGITSHRETTVFPTDFVNKSTTIHLMASTSTTDRKLSAQFSGSYQTNVNRLPNVDLTYYAMVLPPDAPDLLNPDGSINWAPDANGRSTLSFNPYKETLNRFNNETSNLVSNLVLNYSPVKGLTIRSSFGYTSLQSSEIMSIPAISTAPEDRNSFSRFSAYGNSSIKTLIVEPQVIYDFNLGPGKVEALLGGTLQEQDNKGYVFNGSGFSSDELLGDIRSAANITADKSLQTLYHYGAVFGRINYNLYDRYILQLSARRDGSSRFGPENKMNTFGSVAAGWIFSNEPFIRNSVPFLSYGKLKASYGTTGNDQIGDYNYLSLYYSVIPGIPYQGLSGLVPRGLSNPFLQWEETRKANLGLSLGFFKDRILLEANYYRNRSSNQLLSYALPDITGFGSVALNFPATVQNSGLELTLRSDIIKSKAFQWSVNGNLTVPKNKLIRFDDIANSSYANYLFVGKSISTTRQFHFAGVDPATGYYQIWSKKGERTSKVTYPDDQIAYIDRAPKFYGGFENQFSYKGFSLDILFQFTSRKGFNNKYRNGPIGAFGNQPVAVLDRWQKPGDVATYQRFSSGRNPVDMGDTYWSSSSSDAAFDDADFIRLKNLALGWRLPEGLTKKIRFQSLDIFLQAQNILTITNYPGIDPESLSNENIPPLRMITVGIKATF